MVPAAGSLQWGLKASFRNYLETIANGYFTTSGISYSGGIFGFTQTGSSYNTTTGTGTVSFGGTMAITGHNGALNYTLSGFRIRVDSASSATLLVNFVNNGTDGEPSRNNVELVRLNLAAASKTVTSTGAMQYRGVPTTAINAQAVFGDYPAGTAFDSLSFTIGSNAVATGGASTRPASVLTTLEWTPPANPPANDGLTVDDPDSLVAGGDFTAEAAGFEPNETDIKVVIYSTPVVLATDLTADENGIARFSGILPANLTGEHTLTFQGSINVGQVVQIAEPIGAVRTLSLQCTVTEASLNWGFKESFRSYISGAASGEWVVANGAGYNTPEFYWNSVGGSVSVDGVEVQLLFQGDVQFTGHSGALDTTISNPVIELNGDTGTLYLDITGTTQDGAEVNQQAVVFASLDLSAATVTEAEDGKSYQAVPATLTADGAGAFGTYPAGSDLDVLNFAFTVPTDCGTETATDSGISAVPISAPAGQDLSWLWYVLGGLLVVALIAGTAVLVRRRSSGGNA